jgi:hypothetical protein
MKCDMKDAELIMGTLCDEAVQIASASQQLRELLTTAVPLPEYGCYPIYVQPEPQLSPQQMTYIVHTAQLTHLAAGGMWLQPQLK